jgi:hypothetical protein
MFCSFLMKAADELLALKREAVKRAPCCPTNFSPLSMIISAESEKKEKMDFLHLARGQDPVLKTKAKQKTRVRISPGNVQCFWGKTLH